MAGEKTIATLVGKLRFEADNRPLLAFEKNLDRVFSKVDKLGKLAGKKISLKVGLDAASLAANLKVASNTKIVLKNVGVSKEALTASMEQISKKLSMARVSIADVKIPMAALTAQKKLMRNLLESTTIDLPVDVKLKAAEATLRAWKKAATEKFKLYLQADISKQKFYQNVKQSMEYVMGKVGTMKVEPKISLKVDRAALKTEIEDVLRQIERQAKIQIRLTGNVAGEPGAGGGRTSMRQHALTGGVAGAAATWGRGFIPGLGGAFAVSQLNQINQELQAQQNAMTAVTGSQVAGKEQTEWVRNLSNQVGLDFRAVTPSYTKMLASGKTSGMTTESVQGIFQGVSEYGRTMGLDSEAMKGSMRAIEQMMNKNQVMSEELKGQLAERMPGAISAMAEAAGFGTGEDAVAKLFDAMEKGDVKSKDVLEEFAAILAKRAREGGALEKAMQATAAQQARFNNEFSESVEVFAAGGFDKAVGNFFKEMAEGMAKATPLTKALGGAFEYLMIPVNAGIRLIAQLGEALPKLAASLGLGESELAAFGLAAVANLTPIGRIVTVIGALLTAAEDFASFLDGRDSYFGDWFDSLTQEKRDALIKFSAGVKKLASSLGEIAGMIWDGWAGIFGYFEETGAGWSVLNTINKMVESLNALLSIIVKLKGEGSISPEIKTIASNAVSGLPGVPDWMGNAMAQNPDAMLKLMVPGYGLFAGGNAPQPQRLDSQLQGKSMVPVTQTFTFPGMTFQVHGVEGAENMESKLQTVFTNVLQTALNQAKQNIMGPIK